MKTLRSFVLTLAAALLAASAPAAACSVTGDYRVPTNLELARDAEVILVADVVGGGWDEEDPLAGNRLIIRPFIAVKGEFPGGDLELAGVAPIPEPRFLVLSNPYEFEAAHPLSYIGGCIRYLFPRGTTALFFLRREEGQWVPAGGPFSRWAEDVPNPEAPWVRLAKLYTRAAALPEAEGRAALEAERDTLAARLNDPVAQLMAADIERQLTGPNEPWNTIMEHDLGLFGFDEEDDEEQAEEMEEVPRD
jgi:hypothetical protein